MTSRADLKPLVLYRFFDAEDALLYVGITNSPQGRYNQHRGDKRWFKDVVRSTMEHFKTREELEAAEIIAIQTEKPKYNIRHSVISPQKQISVGPRAIWRHSADANHFKRPDAIATDEPSIEERERRLDALEDIYAKRSMLIATWPCPDCNYILLTLQFDGLVKCLNCLNMWEPEELSPGHQSWIREMMSTLGEPK